MTFLACGEPATKGPPRGMDGAIADAAPRDAAVLDSAATSVPDSNTTPDTGSPTAPVPDLTKLQPSCFSASSASPQLTKGSLFSGANWNDPSVLKLGGQYVMYASSDHNLDISVSIYRLVSDDGKRWVLEPSEPVLAPSSLPSAWDHKSVETPSVVFFGGAFHMFYTGYPTVYSDTSSYRIGHAVSSDGIIWTRDAQPLVAPSCPGWTPSQQVCSPGGAPTDFLAFLVAEPGAVVFEGKLYLYFAASGYDAAVANPLLSFGLMTSVDAVSWTLPRKTLVPDQTLYPRSQWLGYSTPAAVVLGDEVHLFFAVVQDMPFRQLALHHARSADGMTGFVQDATPIFSSSTFPWTSREIRAPGPLLDGTALRLWFAGDDGGATPTLTIGEAACAL